MHHGAKKKKKHQKNIKHIQMPFIPVTDYTQIAS